MSEQHPITPTPELVSRWSTSLECPDLPSKKAIYIATQAARWGADTELDACCEFETKCYGEDYAAKLRRYRRPQPKSLAEEALEAAQRFYAKGHEDCTDEEVRDDFDLIRRALERLQELELRDSRV